MLRCLALLALAGMVPAPAQDLVHPINPPATPLPAQADSAGITRFSFIVYGDNRESAATADQATHASLVDSMIQRIAQDRDTDSPIRFVLQSGDGVLAGANIGMWNDHFVPIVNRLTAAGVPFFMVGGNHDVSAATTQDAALRQAGLENLLRAMSRLMPPDGSLQRLKGYPTYAVGYGNVFAIGMDSNLIGDEVQFSWVKAQLEGVDRARFPHVFIFCHQSVFSSGPHGADHTEIQTLELRNRYMPLFRAQHVDAVLAGHEHFYEHWVERYSDASGEHRMDLITSGGGGAPLYVFRSVPETQPYIDAHPENKIRMEQLVRPGAVQGSNPNHYLIVHVDGAKVSIEVVAPRAATPYRPYEGSSSVELSQPSQATVAKAER